MDNTFQQLRTELKSSLDQEDIDFQKVLTLASQIAILDKQNVRFSIDASHISKLGLELVAKQETAIAELVKNAFDADARNVDLIYMDSEKPGGSLEIIDNGTGMEREELINGFMRISTNEKTENPVSKQYLRQRAGRKGIGRFSAQRLGRFLTIKTQVEGADKALEVTIDWDMFETNKDLITITNKINEIEKLANPGTTLRIDKLRDSWTEAQIKRAYRYISELLQPFPLLPSSQSNESDPGFKAAFYKYISGDLVLVADEQTDIFNQATAIFSGYVDENGQAFRACFSKKYQLKGSNQKLVSDDKDQKLMVYDQLCSIHFKAYYYITDELPSGGAKTQIRTLLRERGGIRIYRNGFRVLPYGEAYDDWLGLQRSSALREILPPHHNTNFFGFVEISDSNGERFNETSSREGLIENNAFIQLQDFVHRALMAGVIDIGLARGKKIYASDPKKSTNEAVEPSPKAQVILDLYKKASSESNSTNQNDTNQADYFDHENEDSHNPSQDDEFKEKLLEFDQESQMRLEEIGMLRVLAALGITIGEFTHEVRHSLGAAVANVSHLNAFIDQHSEGAKALSDMGDNLHRLQAYARYFDNAVTDNAHRILQVQELRDILIGFEEIILPTLKRQHIELIKEVNGYDLFTKPMHKSEWASILLNLFTNSIKAIKRANAKGKILIRAGVEGETLYLEFADNGDGIPEQNKEQIFEAFFTTSAPAAALASDSDQLIGTGLGLKIVKDVLEGADGEIYLTTPPFGYNTCFRVEVPKAKKEDIPNDAY